MGFTHADYRVAWICALPVELAAAKAMLDNVDPKLPQPATDQNTYTLGRLGNHSIVVACLPSGVCGTTSAATVLSQMLSTFPYLRFALMVGIGGGVPTSNIDIRLGDVVVSLPTATSGGVIQYDYGKTVPGDCFQRTGSLNGPPQYLLTAISEIRSDYTSRNRDTEAIMADILKQQRVVTREQFRRPTRDWLFKSTYDHQNNDHDCSACDSSQLLDRTPRKTDEPHVHYGLIASGNQVMKDAKCRDSIAKETGVICFEMEAAGLMNQLPCLVIRGICDYCDSHKNKEWQGYSALSAAAYAKLLLRIVAGVGNRQSKEEITFTPEDRMKCLRSLFITDPAEDRNALKRRKGDRVPGTCNWILETEEIKTWLGLRQSETSIMDNLLWLYGNPGTGKSTMAITLAEELPNHPSFVRGEKRLAYFFCDSGSGHQRTDTAILRGLLYQLGKQHNDFLDIIIPWYLERKDRFCTSFDTLWDALMDVGAKAKDEEIYCIIDALDECDIDSQRILLAQISQWFRSNNDQRVSTNIHILITSRPYPEISRSLGQMPHKDLSSYWKVQEDLSIFIEEKVRELQQRNHYSTKVAQQVSQMLNEKSEHTFLWVGIACGELADVRSRDAVKRLQTLPKGLHSLYQSLLAAALGKYKDDSPTILEMMGIVAFAKRPLRVAELSVACQLYSDEDEEDQIQFIREDIEMCRLMIIVQDGVVRLLHKSVKDFLIHAWDVYSINELKTHAALANRCISHFLASLPLLKDMGDQEATTGFLEYAVLYWPHHAASAGSEFISPPEHACFFQLHSDERETWLRNHRRTAPSSSIPKNFSIFHIAAKWGILSLVHFVLTTRTRDDSMPDNRPEVKFADILYKAKNGVTPIEVAAEGGQIDVMGLLLEKGGPNMLITERALIAAAGNPDNGQQIMQLLLDRPGDPVQITQGVIEAAAGNSKSGEEVVRLLLDQYGHRIPITADVAEAAGRGQKENNTMMKLLLHCQRDCITNEAIRAICGIFDAEIVQLVLNHQGDKVLITEGLIEAAVCNQIHGDEVMKLLVDQYKDHITITEKVVKAAVQNLNSGKEIIRRLLIQYRGQVPVTRDIVEIAVKQEEVYRKKLIRLLLHCQREYITPGAMATIWERFDQEILLYLLDRHGKHILVTDDLIDAAVSNQAHRKEALKLLLRCETGHITSKALSTVCGNSGPDLVELILNYQQDHTLINEDVLKSAAGNWMSGKEVIELLLNICGDKLQAQVTEAVVIIAAGNGGNGKEVMEFLLERMGDLIHITEDVIKAAGRNRMNGNKVMELLLQRRRNQILVTEDVVKAIASNDRLGTELMEIFLNQYKDQVPITEDIIQIAVGNWGNGEELTKLLLDQKVNPIDIITEEVIRSAIGNWVCGKEVTKLLLLRYGCQIQLTKETAKATAGNWAKRNEIMELLINHCQKCHITVEVVAMACEQFRPEIVGLMLNQQGNNVPITKDMVKAAARNRKHRKGIMMLLLGQQRYQITDGAVAVICKYFNSEIVEKVFDQQGDRISITGDIIMAAVRNEKHGEEIMKLLLDRKSHQTMITKDIAKATAYNRRRGKQVMRLLLNQQETQITVEAATVICRYFDIEIAGLLLDQKGDQIQITEDIINAARHNRRYGQDVTELLLNKRMPSQFTQGPTQAEATDCEVCEQATQVLRECREEIETTQDATQPGKPFVGGYIIRMKWRLWLAGVFFTVLYMWFKEPSVPSTAMPPVE